MLMQISGRRIPLSAAFREHVQRRFAFALGRFGHRVARVLLKFTDINGRRGGVDKQCRVAIQLDRGPRIIVDTRDVELEAVVDQAAQRAGHAVRRELERQRHRRVDSLAILCGAGDE